MQVVHAGISMFPAYLIGKASQVLAGAVDVRRMELGSTLPAARGIES
jgi:hypothetical protein